MSQPFDLQITPIALKDIRKLTPKLKDKLYDILNGVIAHDPYCGKKLIGDLQGYYSYRLTYQDRIVYRIDAENKIIYVIRAKSHYS